MSAGVSKSLEEQLRFASKQVGHILAIDAACGNVVADIEALTAAATLITQALRLSGTGPIHSPICLPLILNERIYRRAGCHPPGRAGRIYAH